MGLFSGSWQFWHKNEKHEMVKLNNITKYSTPAYHLIMSMFLLKIKLHGTCQCAQNNTIHSGNSGVPLCCAAV